MSTLPQTTRGKEAPAAVRRHTVIMGRQDFLSIVLRLIGVEIYKVRRRVMSKVLSSIAILVMLAAFGLIAAISLVITVEPSSAFLPPSCALVRTPTCLDHPATQAELAQAAKTKQDTVKNVSSSLRLPDSLTFSVQTINTIGLVLLVILAGTIVGGEYGGGTVRLVFTRGPTRTQFLISKIGAILACSALTVAVLTIIGIVVGALANFITGIGIDFGFFTGAWVLHALLYLLIAVLGLFVYSMIALFLSTMGKATAAGVAGALVWWVLEGIVGQVLTAIGFFNQGPLGNFLKAVPDYFIGNNIGALLQNQSRYLSPDQPSTLPDLHALLVITAYLILFIGLSWWISERRDVTN
ncbi:MAG TPA: ABC transporter permease [Ktedonobacteraceae bacterium]|nr:ABC transporter permease [Ktedonobacteraceae bacterium]